MRSKLYKAAVLLLLMTLVGVVIFFGLPVYIEHAEDTSLQIVGRRAYDINAVEVLRLTETDDSGPAGSYLVHYDSRKRGIAARQTLTGHQADELIELWGNVRILGRDSYEAACHDPGFVLRFLDGRKCLFEVAVCFHCENISWQSVPGFTSCRQMAPSRFDAKPNMDALKTFLSGLP
jgi:hypothetical protein